MNEMGVYEEIIVGTDGSVTAGRAVRRAAVMAASMGARLIVASAYLRTRPDDLGPASAKAKMPNMDAMSIGYRGAQETAQDGAAIASKAAANVEIDVRTPQGDPADALLDLAESFPGSLLVIGGQGLGASGLFLLGNVPHKISHHPVGDILIVRTGEDREEGPPRTVLIGFDGSATATIALDRGFEVARAIGATATVLTIGQESWARDVLAEAEGRAQQVGIQVQTEAHEGDAATVLVDRAGAHDLLVLGNRGMTGARRFLLGSVPNKVSHHAPADLLIVKTT